MSDSPGPGWWLASDGRWYPQRWEYQSCTTRGIYNDVDGPVQEAMQMVAALGQHGWEMVNFTVQPHWFIRGMAGNTRSDNKGWSVVCFMKRPIAS